MVTSNIISIIIPIIWYCIIISIFLILKKNQSNNKENMRKIIVSFLAFLSIFYLSAQEKELLSPQAFLEKVNASVDNPSVAILDVRTYDEFNTGHIENAILIDYRSDDFSKQIKSLDPNKEYLIYCRSGVRSSSAIDSLKILGFNHLLELDGGINAWKQNKLPVVGIPDDKISLDDYNGILTSNELVLIDFYAPWCGPCLKMTPMFEEIAKKYEGKVKLVKINADENKNLSDHFIGKGFPLLIAYKNQEIVWEKIGLLEQDVLEKDIDKLLAL